MNNDTIKTIEQALIGIMRNPEQNSYVYRKAQEALTALRESAPASAGGMSDEEIFRVASDFSMPYKTDVIHFAREILSRSNAPQPEAAQTTIASAIHYPDEWDTAAYPTLESAVHELTHWHKCCMELENKKDEQPIAPDYAEEFKTELNAKLNAALPADAAHEECAKLIAEMDFEYNKKTNDLIARHAEQIAALKAPQPEACVCGEPEMKGAIHRTDGPCHLPEAAQPAPIQLDDFRTIVNCVANNLGEYALSMPNQQMADMLSQYANELFDALARSATDKWHDAVLTECMRVESCYVENDPARTLNNLIDWHIVEIIREAARPDDETYLLKREIHNLKRHIEDYCKPQTEAEQHAPTPVVWMHPDWPLDIVETGDAFCPFPIDGWHALAALPSQPVQKETETEHALWNKAVAIRELKWKGVPYPNLLKAVIEIIDPRAADAKDALERLEIAARNAIEHVGSANYSHRIIEAHGMIDAAIQNKESK